MTCMDKISLSASRNPLRWDLGQPATQQAAFRVLRASFGLIWLFNALYQLHPAYINGLFLQSIAAQQGQSTWYVHYTHWAMTLIAAIGAPKVAIFIATMGFLLAFSLLTGLAVRTMAWFGAIFSFVLWTLNGHLGGPYTEGATDPGTLIVYSLTFVAILLVEPAAGEIGNEISRQRRYRIFRLLFGGLWAFDAAWKWTPFFIHHPLSYLIQAEAGQPAWIVAYIQTFIDLINLVGQQVFGIATAVVETLLAICLLTGRGMRYLLPLGFIYSLGIWTTAEGWGGPYGVVTGVGGDVLGTGVIYSLIFLYLMVMYPSRPKRPA